MWGSCYLGLVRTGQSSQAKLTTIKSVKARYVRSFWHTHFYRHRSYLCFNLLCGSWKLLFQHMQLQQIQSGSGLGLASQSMEVHPLAVWGTSTAVSAYWSDHILDWEADDEAHGKRDCSLVICWQQSIVLTTIEGVHTWSDRFLADHIVQIWSDQSPSRFFYNFRIWDTK